MKPGVFIINLSSKHLTVLKYILVLLHGVLIISSGIILGALLISITFRISAFLRRRNDYREFSALIMKDAPRRPILWIMGLLMPYAMISFILLQLYNGIDFNFLPLLLCGIALIPVSYSLFYFYVVIIERRNLNDLKAALPAITSFLLLTGSIFLYSSASALLLDPEKWLFTEFIPGATVTWNGVTKFLVIFFLLLSVAGTWLLRNVYRKKYNFEFINNFSSAFLILTVLPQPLLILWNAILVPPRSVSLINIIIFAFVFVLLGTIAFSGLKIFESGSFSSAGRIFVTLLIVILLSSVNDLIAREQALKGQVLNLRPLMEKVRVEEKVEVKVEKEMPSKGEEVFTRVCSGCHSFEAKIVGPALNDVIPKYRDKKELGEFIKNPVKKNPDFPEMPPPGLSDEEVDAVAEFLMGRVKR